MAGMLNSVGVIECSEQQVGEPILALAIIEPFTAS